MKAGVVGSQVEYIVNRSVTNDFDAPVLIFCSRSLSDAPNILPFSRQQLLYCFSLTQTALD